MAAAAAQVEDIFDALESDDDDDDELQAASATPSRPRRPLVKRSFTEVFLRPDGKLGVGGGAAAGKFGGGNSAGLTAGKWHRVVITCDMEKGFFHIYVNGETAITMRFTDKSSKSPYNLGKFFTLLGDADPERVTSQRAHVATIQVRSFAVNQSTARRLGVAGDTLLGVEYLKRMTKFLSKMGYPIHWSIKALNKSGGNEVLASDWIISNRAVLEEEDRMRRLRIVAAKLSLMGYPVTWCMRALETNDNDVYKATQWLQDHSLEGTRATDAAEFELKEDEQADIKRVLATRLQGIRIEKKVTENSLFRVLEHVHDPIDIGLDTLVTRPQPPRLVNFGAVQKERKVRSLLRTVKTANDNLAVVYARKCVLAVLDNWVDSEISKFAAFAVKAESTGIGAGTTAGTVVASPQDRQVRQARAARAGRDPSPRGRNLVQPRRGRDASPSSRMRSQRSKAMAGIQRLAQSDPHESFGVFLQLVEYSALSGGLGVLRKAVLDTLRQELTVLYSRVKGDVPTDEMKDKGPLSRALVCQAIYHLVQICQDPNNDVDTTRSELDMGAKWNAAIVVWVVGIFLELLETTPKTRVRDWFAQYLLSPQLVNLVFECISMLSGKKQLSFVRLLCFDSAKRPISSRDLCDTQGAYE